ncbi:hypothetical protein ACMA5I_07040 [Paracoccaceae bacterium GXU_MW_L88]
MANPEDDKSVETQAKRHRGPVVGIIIAVVLVVLGFVFFTGGEVAEGVADEPATEAAPE